MKRLFAAAATLVLTSGAALAADASVIGDWLVKDGYAHIRIDNCAGRMWGIVAWEQKAGLDVENPDPAKKSRPTLGMPIIMGFAPAKEPGKWSGEIYNSNNGKMYAASISLADENTLDVEGCLVWPLCQTQKWTRVKTPPPNAAPLPPIPGAQKQSPPAKKGAVAAAAPSEVCARVVSEGAPASPGTVKK